MPGSVKERDYLCVLRMDSELVDMGLIKIIAPHLFYWSPNKKFANIQVCTDDNSHALSSRYSQSILLRAPYY